MLHRCQIFEQNIVLGADTHNLTNFICFFEHIVVVSNSRPFWRLNKTSEHADCGGFTSTILSEQCKNLVLVYFQIDSFDSLKPIIISFLQTLNP